MLSQPRASLGTKIQSLFIFHEKKNQAEPDNNLYTLAIMQLFTLLFALFLSWLLKQIGLFRLYPTHIVTVYVACHKALNHSAIAYLWYRRPLNIVAAKNDCIQIGAFK